VNKPSLTLITFLLLGISYLIAGDKGCGKLPPKLEVCYSSNVTLNATDNIFTKPEYSAAFDGFSYLTSGNSNAVNFKSGNLSIGTWIFPEALNGRRVLLNKLFGKKAPYGSYFFYLQDGIPRFTIKIHGGTEKSAVMVQSNQPLKLREWVFLSVICNADSGYIRLYVNGIKKDQIPWSGRFYSIDNEELTIGAIKQNIPKLVYKDYFIGLIDNIRIWKKVVPIKQMLTRNILKDSLLLAYEFNDSNSQSITSDASNKSLNANLIGIKFVPITSTFYKKSAIKYSWSTGDSTSIIKLSPIKSEWIKLIIKTYAGICKDSTELIVNPSEIKIGGKSVVIQKSSEQYGVPFNPGSKYEWDVLGGEILGASIGNSVMVIWGKKGKGLISVQETTKKGCKGLSYSLDIDKRKK